MLKGIDPYRFIVGYLALIVVLCAAIIMDPLSLFGRGNSPPEVVDQLPNAVQVAGDLRAAEQPSTQEPVAPALRVADGGLEQTTAAILAGLAQKTANPEDAGLEDMSLAALTGLRALTEVRPDPETTLDALITQALREGQSDAYIDALVNEAAGRGAVTVPAMLVTSDGRVDTAVLLASLVAASQAVELGEGDVSLPAAAVNPDVQALGAGEALTYTVEVGDSLGALALRFYGNSGLYPLIYEANRDVMPSPDQISVGQRLLIPAQL